ncbi:TIGR02611 family protein, partial [Streptomyces seoulensis]|uniref:TIGR02611 family protein n=1 Tax=Streptomyces seoulensis TaxID=73044 RepID=UPI0033BC7976
MNTGSDEPGEVAVMTDETETGEGRADDGLGSRAPEFVKQRRALHLSWQVGVFVLGLAVVVAGVIMLPLPGPGWVVIFGGMAIWATEFVWAQLVLRWTKRKVTEAAQKPPSWRPARRSAATSAAAPATGACSTPSATSSP